VSHVARAGRGVSNVTRAGRGRVTLGQGPEALSLLSLAALQLATLQGAAMTAHHLVRKNPMRANVDLRRLSLLQPCKPATPSLRRRHWPKASK
jgi:hypothetical protein